MQIDASFMTLGSPQEVFHAETQEGNLCFFPPFHGSRELWERGYSQEKPSQDWIGQTCPSLGDLGQAVKLVWVSVSSFEKEN